MIAPTHGGEDNVILISPPLEPSDDYYQLSGWANRVEFSDLRLTDESIIGVPLEITYILVFSTRTMAKEDVQFNKTRIKLSRI